MEVFLLYHCLLADSHAKDGDTSRFSISLDNTNKGKQ